MSVFLPSKYIIHEKTPRHKTQRHTTHVQVENYIFFKNALLHMALVSCAVCLVTFFIAVLLSSIRSGLPGRCTSAG